jgi:hypothetical protein
MKEIPLSTLASRIGYLPVGGDGYRTQARVEGKSDPGGYAAP